MRQRQLRISVTDVAVRFGDLTGTVVDISLSGALVELNGPVEVGAENTLTLRRGAGSLDLAVRVARIGKPKARSHWVSGKAYPAGMHFTKLTAAERKAIPRLLGW